MDGGAGVHTVELSSDGGSIVAVSSADGEVIPLLAPLPLSDQVEMWLAGLADAISQALQVGFKVKGLAFSFPHFLPKLLRTAP